MSSFWGKCSKAVPGDLGLWKVDKKEGNIPKDRLMLTATTIVITL